MNRKNKHIFIIAVLLLLTGNAMAQNDRQYVIKKGDHLLAHVYNASESRWELQDVVDNTSSHNFSPNCLWYSSNNYNYYFMDGTTKMYLKAPLAPNGTITVDENPGTDVLNNITQEYFFYDWDHGLARGIQHFGGECPTVYNVEEGDECWEAVWVSYESDTWKMSSVYGYDPTTNAARFFSVSITEHPAVTTTVDENTGLADLVGFSLNYNESHQVTPSINDYQFATTPAYTTYVINESTPTIHNYWGDVDHGTATPGSVNSAVYEATSVEYSWELSGEGATYLSFAATGTPYVHTSTAGQPTVYYRTPNNTGHNEATLTLTVTYHKENQPDVQQTSSATIMVNTPCQNPPVGGLSATVNDLGAIITWTPMAESYVVSWRKTGTTTWTSASVGNVNSYTITGLEYGGVEYEYKVRATCDVEPTYTYPRFTTGSDPGLLVTGAVFGGGRMADVGGKTEVVIINCDSIAAVFGGNDIAGSVADSSIIILGINASNVAGSYSHEYNLDAASTKVRVSDVYGGGNGYYAYNGSSFVPASSDYTSETVAVGASVMAMTQAHTVGNAVWTNNGTADKVLNFPSIPKTSITVTNDVVKVDSLFGGAKNAFLTYNDWHYNGDSIVINGGTILAVFGGNNVGGTQGQGKHYIAVNGTTTNLTANINNTATTGYGRDFGIRYLFGGGNKVYGSTTDVYINGGQCDTIFAGGNAADVYAANLTVNCTIAVPQEGVDYVYGNVYSNAIDSYDEDEVEITPLTNYGWDGINGIYNVRTLFGGNNMATFDSKLNHKVPTITLTSGSIGTVYGGGNSGDMWGLSTDDCTPEHHTLTINGEMVKYGTHVKMDSPTILIDILYGGCQMSNVRYGTWVELKEGHVGTVYGGCNVSGDVGSTRVNLNATTSDPEAYQEVYGGTWVVDDGGIVYKNLFAGGNGFYHCVDDYGFYTSTLSYTNRNYFGLAAPTHNETHVLVNDGARVKGNVYAGGNLARVGFDNSTVGENPFPTFVGWASVKMSGGTVDGDVYGGGNMADVNGSNEVQVSGGNIGQSLYGGNDRMGKVAQVSNRKLPSSYDYASDQATSLLDPKVYTYVGLTGDPHITNVYGGGNGDYAYFTTFQEAQDYINAGGPKETVVSCDVSNQPIQRCTFVDIGVDGGVNGAQIGTVYGGGDGVTVTEFLKVFLNVQSTTSPIGYSNVGTIFGGNNKGDLELVADIVLLNGQVNTVYGGCNEGAMTAYNNESQGHMNLKTIGGYENIGSYVRLLESYDPDGDPSTNNSVTPNIKVVDAIYGGCRMNGVRGEDLEHNTYPTNSLVLVEGGDFSNMTYGIFGGSDISGTVSGDSRVAVVGGIVGKVYGGGNGYYTYDNGNVYTIPTSGDPVLVATGITTAPICAQSGADILGGRVGTDASHRGEVFGGGYGELTSTTGNVIVNIGPATATSWTGLPVIYGEVYGGSALGTVNTDGTNSTTVNFLNGTLHGSLFGGGLGEAGNENVGKGQVNGKVYVSISNADQLEENCFIDLRDADVYGCNNTNGSPKDDVRVDVYKTAYNFSDYTSGNNYTSQEGDDPYYAIRQVFGGGNQADYRPVAVGSGETPHKTLVFVHDCSNTIRRVFSGGNAAAATKVAATIEGGRFDYIFGGGNGEVSAANIGAGGTNLRVEAGIIEHLFGGSNQTGSIAGPVNTLINGNHYVPAGEGVTNPCNEDITEFFGGSNQALLQNNVTSLIECSCGSFDEIYGGSKLADIIGDVTLTVRGGTCIDEHKGVFGGSKGQSGDDDDDAADIDGNVTLNLEGGNIYNAFGGSNINGNITGNIVVNVIDMGGTCGLDLTNVYGGGNVTAYTPTSSSAVSPVVNVVHIADEQGIKGSVFGGAKGSAATVSANPQVNFGYNETTMSGYLPADYTLPESPRAYVSCNVFGGGDLAAVDGNTEVNVFKGEIVKKLVGGSNEANVSGNTTVNISGGSLCTSTDITQVGVYGGCNNSGNVGGDVVLTITGTDDTQTTIGVQQVVADTKKPVNVHGGGYGAGTSVTGNVTVTYGSLLDPESEYPKLYGDLYGGSALGNVNTYNNNKSTTVNLYNGSIICISEQVTVPGLPHPVTYYYSGNVFGGGLGETGVANVDKGKVNGKVFVNVGKADVPPSSELRGHVTLIGCNVYGCNNTNGSPQDDVRVDVYQTAHTPGVSGNTIQGSGYAILRVFGGGNEANYAPENGSSTSTKKTHVYVHGCENTIRYVYGGGNAADAVGVVSVIEGGRFDEVYGGGNGQISPANIGEGSVGFAILAGHVNFVYRGNNKAGEIGGTPYDATPEPGYVDCGELIVDSYYFGDNEAEHYGDIINTITCEDASSFVYKYVYAGSRWATVYGDIKLTVQGGDIKYLFGGSKGYIIDNIPANVRRFPSYAELKADDELEPANRKYSVGLREHMHYDPANASTFNTSLVGTGGNIELVIQGGNIGEVIGGCDELGNVEGKISVIVDESNNSTCPLFVGNVYGASKHTNYAPVYDQYNPSSTTALPTPKVSINRGTIGGTTHFAIDGTHPIIDTTFYGNVFGGADLGNVTCNPKVVVGGGTSTDAITIKGDVYGGGNKGDITGSPQVVVVPGKYSLSVSTPTGGSIKARNIVSDGTTLTLGEGTEIPLVAVPAIPTSSTGYAFDYWTVGGTGASVGNTKSPYTVFSMGATNATLSATFRTVDAHQLTMVADYPDRCAGFKVYGATYTGTVWVTENASTTVEAIPATGYAFSHWTITETVPNSGASLNAGFSASTIFNMGTSNVTLTAHFVPLYTLTLTTSHEGCTLWVNGVRYTAPVSLVEGAAVSIEARPAEGFTEWTVTTGPETATVGDPSAARTTFTMGAGDATVTATYGTGRRGETNNNRNPRH